MLVDRRNLTIPEGVRSLSDKWIGPHRIVKDKWDGHAYELDIPVRTRIHNVIHTSLLKPFKLRPIHDSHPLRDPVIGKPDAIQTDCEEDMVYHIEQFVDSRWFGRNDRHVKYRVRWLGYKPFEDTWQSIEETGWPASSAILQAYKCFHDGHPHKAADPRIVTAIAECT